ncbi:galactonate dehydratase [Peribacillus simplex]|uniref:Galactonate dehydratase n=2 Tax=Peribacillus simplex TaxID=1478 RepID=A0A223EFE2_9BACI|nr:galactonate dehydratase [Peribacillus simplex]ASS93795.1 galactonate dehydratase [Peribacillus simplex NBRC 15720 = DSM 1321]MEC1399495.1 galactonate dehydratase [Peribacillus simplex]MED3908725.1 galactonate dehydratase [Peribacillus simplex]MED3983179.1 galactonate dehydratase [Peribacillus simplex]MED4095277.1 galactonate dehydratase [Peribacillus simplex]
MKIKSYELFQVPPRWLFLKIETDEGIVGWGEPVIEGKAATVKAAVDELMENLIGKDPLNIEDHWNLMYRAGFYRGGPILMSAISGIDQALWDIKGKYYNAPVHQLLGGKARDSIKVYSWIGGDRPSDVGEAAKAVVSKGFTAVKMNGTEELQYVDSYEKIDQVIERIAAVRESVGPHIGIGIDFHGRVHKPMAKILVKELEAYRPMFIEEPVLPENNEALREIVNHTAIPIATGERMYSKWDFKKLLTDGYADIIQPDLSHAGGITECKKIISMAEAFDVAAAPHCPLGPIALAACLQVDATCHNAFIQEQSLGIHYNQGSDLLDYIVDNQVFKYEEGYVKIPDGAGLGIEINEDHVRKMTEIGHNWRNPVWRHKDGSIAEW